MKQLGIDVGAETVKVVEVDGGTVTRRRIEEHRKDPGPVVRRILREFSPDAAAVTGRFGRVTTLPRIPLKEAQAAGVRFLHGDEPATVVSIGAHGFSVLELRGPGLEIFRENSRCSQGTGNFLRQLVERFGLTIEEAGQMAARVDTPAPLSGRCPVILKTDMTHLANKGESRDRILAGLYDAVCENVQVLVKPRVSPSRVVLVGGLTRSDRIRAQFRKFLDKHEMQLVPTTEDHLYVEAIGAALLATEPLPDEILADVERAPFESLPPLADFLGKVRRMEPRPLAPIRGGVVLGFDIGSTGSKAVAIDVESRDVVWEGYRNTSGDPIGAAQALLRSIPPMQVMAVGATGSGREIVGSLMTTCYGAPSVYVLNEIAAHATGALHYDPRVDTIFEIGGQDAKYIRLVDGRVVDAAMNEACSAGTGSFIEEQGKRFQGVENVVQLGRAAIDACGAVSLGQHCSVFMAEIIDEAAAAGVPSASIIPGIYDSVIQNYLNRVKGSRSIGEVIFCQGMPFSAPALGAAVARQTGCEVVVPPNPGTVGALGIALLTLQHRHLAPIDPAKFLEARVEKKDTFVCKSARGCGGSGNKCRIDRITTGRKVFTWGGGCSLHDRGTGRQKLPDLAPDPFRRRDELVPIPAPRGKPRIAMTDEFVLKELFPFFVTFLYEIGFDPVVRRNATHAVLKRGIEESNVPFCAPMQLYHGLVSEMSQDDAVFLPMLRDIPRTKNEPHSVTCPIEQGSADLLKWDLPEARILSPVIDATKLRESCARLAKQLGVKDWSRAFDAAARAQRRFEESCLQLGREALDFCKKNNVIPVVVLGRSYTIYNTVLNSNVPAILREQGVLPIPLDCFPVGDDLPTIDGVYWGYSQRILRAAEEIRRTPGVYSLFCSNYSCGPDSFTTHFYAYAMAGKPFAIIETDGHSGDAGTKTRVEAFLYCVRQDRGGAPAKSLKAIDDDRITMTEILRSGDTLLVPWLSHASEAVVACLRGVGVRAESLGVPDREALRIGRRHTSGKECVPMALTLGRALQRIGRDDGRYVIVMPTSAGPCRFGVYNLLQKIVLERLDLRRRVRVWSPVEGSYFEQTGKGFGALAFAGMLAADLLDDRRELYELLEGVGTVSAARAVYEAASGRLFGVTDLLRRAPEPEPAPTVLMVGEIYVRLDPFSTDGIVGKLRSRGIRVIVAPMTEWLEYTSHLFSGWLPDTIQRRIQDVLYRAAGVHHSTVRAALAAAEPWVRSDLEGEAVLTLGSAVHEWREGRIDAVLNVGPHECMPSKIAEAQFFHVAEKEGLLSLTLGLNGDPVDSEIVDRFAYEVRERFRRRGGASEAKRAHGAPELRRKS